MYKSLTVLASIAALLFHGIESFSIEPQNAFFLARYCAPGSGKKPLFLHPDQASELVNAAEAELKECVKQRHEDDVVGIGSKKQKLHNGGGVSGARRMAGPKDRSILSYLIPSPRKTNKSK